MCKQARGRACWCLVKSSRVVRVQEQFSQASKGSFERRGRLVNHAARRAKGEGAGEAGRGRGEGCPAREGKLSDNGRALRVDSEWVDI